MAAGRLVHKAITRIIARYPKLAYVHVPKCAGQSAVRSLYDAAYPRALKATRAYRRIGLRANEKAAGMLGLEMMKCREVELINCLSDPLARFVFGHVHANPAVVKAFPDWKFVTLLRDPRQRFLSHYVYNQHKSSDWVRIPEKELADYVRTDRARRSAAVLANYFSGMDWAAIQSDPESAVEASLANLSAFASVGFLDDLDGWLDGLERLLGRRPAMRHVNKNPKPDRYQAVQASAELNATVEQLCAMDRRIYEAARESFSRG